MKVSLVGPSYPHRGGIAQYTASLSRALSQDHEVQVVSFRRLYPDFLFPGTTQHDRSAAPLEVRTLPLLDSLSPGSWRNAAAAVLDFEPRVVVFQWWQPFFGPPYMAMLKRFRRRPGLVSLLLCHNIYSHHEGWLPGRRGVERIIVRRVFGLADGCLLHSEKMVPEARRVNPGMRYRRIYHPRYNFYGGEDETRSGGVSGVPRLLFFGKIRRYKGLRTFLQALGELKRMDFEFQATIAGEFYVDSKPYFELTDRLGIEGCLTWIDRYLPNEEVGGVFRNHDLVVLPYVDATQSGVVPLAYQFGLPVIATDVGGLAEVVLEGETGFLVPPRDPEKLAARIRDTFCSNHYEDFRENVLEFRKQLTWSQVVDSIEGLVEEIDSRR